MMLRGLVRVLLLCGLTLMPAIPVRAADGYQWTSPLPGSAISLNGHSASHPTVAVNKYGNAAIAWAQHYNNEYRVVVGWRLNGLWSLLNPAANNNIDPQFLLSPAGGHANYLDIAMGGFEDIAVVWRQKQNGLFGVYYAHYRQGQWEKPQNLGETFSLPGSKAENGHVSMNDRGDTIVAWQQQNPNSGFAQIYAAYYQNGHYEYQDNWVPQWIPGQWISKPFDFSNFISFGSSDASDLEVAIDNAGVATVVWNEETENIDRIFVSQFDPATTTWSPPFLLSAFEGGAFRPYVAANARTGQRIVTWSQQIGPDLLTYKAESIGSGPWTFPGPEQRLSLQGQTCCIGAMDEREHAAIDDIGTIVVVWTQLQPNQFLAESHVFFGEHRSGQWTLPAQLADTISPQNQPSVAWYPKVAVSNARYATIVWPSKAAGATKLFMSEYIDVDSVWQWLHAKTTNKTLNGNVPTTYISRADLGLSDRGYGLVGWSQESNGNVDMSEIYISERLPTP